MKTKLLAFYFTLGFTATLLIVPVSSPGQEKPALERVRIAVATSSMAFLVPFVAKDRGLYLKNGAEVELIQMRPNVAMAALLSGDIDYVELIGSIIRSAAKGDRKSTRLNSSHLGISYAVFCLKK